VNDLVKRLTVWGEGSALASHFLGKISARETCAEAAAEIERLRDALTGIKRAGKARMASYGDEHSYYYVTALAALEQNKPET
jgi:hypothetical protein